MACTVSHTSTGQHGISFLVALELTVRYQSLYFALVMFIASLSTLISLAVSGLYDEVGI
jgi:hypothetical protein